MHGLKGKGRAKNRKDEAEERVHGDLGRGRGDKGGNGRRGIGIGVGQPDMQREERHLEGEAYAYEGKGHLNGAGVGHGFDPRGEIGHVERAGHRVHQADADEDKGRADRAQDQVVIGRHQGAAVPAEANQPIGRKRRDLHKDEDVKGVAGNGNAQQPSETKQKDCAKIRATLGFDFAGCTRWCVGQDHGADQGHQ